MGRLSTIQIKTFIERTEIICQKEYIYIYTCIMLCSARGVGVIGVL